MLLRHPEVVISRYRDLLCPRGSYHEAAPKQLRNHRPLKWWPKDIFDSTALVSERRKWRLKEADYLVEKNYSLRSKTR